MALSISEVAWKSTNRLMYLINQSGNSNPESLTIPNDAGASPDLRTDALAGVAFGPPPIGGVSLYSLMNARVAGYAQLPPNTPLNQGQARALLMGWDMSKLTITNYLIPYAQTRVIGNENTTALAWGVDVTVNVNGDPVIVVETNAFGSANNRGLALIEIQLRHTLLG